LSQEFDRAFSHDRTSDFLLDLASRFGSMIFGGELANNSGDRLIHDIERNLCARRWRQLWQSRRDVVDYCRECLIPKNSRP
jgi:hypothetical protein